MAWFYVGHRCRPGPCTQGKIDKVMCLPARSIAKLQDQSCPCGWRTSCEADELMTKMLYCLLQTCRSWFDLLPLNSRQLHLRLNIRIYLNCGNFNSCEPGRKQAYSIDLHGCHLEPLLLQSLVNSCTRIPIIYN